MNSSNNQTNLEPSYLLPKSLKKILPLGGFIFLILGFLGNFNFKDKILYLINNNLKIDRQCQLQVNDLSYEIFSLGLNLSQFNFTDKCPSELQLLGIKKIYLGFRGPSFSPFGIQTKLILESAVIPQLEMMVSLGLGKIKILFDEQVLDIKDFSNFLPIPINIFGKLNITGYVVSDFKKINQFKLSMAGQNLTLPSQELQSFIIPNIILKKSSIVTESESENEYKINNLVLGEPSDTIQILSEGKLKLNKNFKQSQISLRGKFKFNSEFKESLPILNLLLSGKNKTQGYYQFSLNGTPSNPKFKVE